MSDEYRGKHNKSTEETAETEEEFAAKVMQRRKERERQRRRRKRLTVLIIIVVFALLASMCGRDIVRLKAENRALKKQQAALEKERDDLKEELKNTGKQEYIREQARKQLRLLNPGEILFTFEEDGEEDGNADE